MLHQGTCLGCGRVQVLTRDNLCGACHREGERRTYRCGPCHKHHTKSSVIGKAHLPERMQRIARARA